jgi:hypothetical protein
VTPKTRAFIRDHLPAYIVLAVCICIAVQVGTSIVSCLMTPPHRNQTK